MGASEVPESIWIAILEQNKLSLAVKVLRKSHLSVQRTLELFSEVLWSLVTYLQLSFKGDTPEGSCFFLEKFALENDLVDVLNYIMWTIRGQLMVLDRFNPLKRVVEHNSKANLVWLQYHNLPLYAVK